MKGEDQKVVCFFKIDDALGRRMRYEVRFVISCEMLENERIFSVIRVVNCTICPHKYDEERSSFCE